MHVKETVGEFDISAKTKVVVSLVDTGTKDKIDIRKFFLNFDKNWLPTTKGISFHLEQLPIIINILNKALDNNTKDNNIKES